MRKGEKPRNIKEDEILSFNLEYAKELEQKSYAEKKRQQVLEKNLPKKAPVTLTRAVFKRGEQRVVEPPPQEPRPEEVAQGKQKKSRKGSMNEKRSRKGSTNQVEQNQKEENHQHQKGNKKDKNVRSNEQKPNERKKNNKKDENGEGGGAQKQQNQKRNSINPVVQEQPNQQLDSGNIPEKITESSQNFTEEASNTLSQPDTKDSQNLPSTSNLEESMETAATKKTKARKQMEEEDEA